jgi:hypothetical protein
MSAFSKIATATKAIAATVLSVVAVPLGLVGRPVTSVCHRLFPENETVTAANHAMQAASMLPLVLILSSENYSPP